MVPFDMLNKLLPWWLTLWNASLTSFGNFWNFQNFWKIEHLCPKFGVLQCFGHFGAYMSMLSDSMKYMVI